MSIEGVSGSVGVVPFENEQSYRDSLANLATKVGQGFTFPSRHLVESFCTDLTTLIYFHPGEYNQSHSRIQKIAKMVFFDAFKIPFTLFFSSFAAVGLVLAGVGNLLARKGCRVDQGQFRGKMNKEIKLMLLNAHMQKGPAPSLLPLWNQGLLPANSRLKRLVATIRDNNPDIVFLPNVNASMRSSLRHALNDRYHYFFSSVGRKVLGFDASFFVAFRGTLKSVPQFIPFKTQDHLMERGFFIFETQDTRYFFTHNPTLGDLKEICAQKMEGKKEILMGDLGFERGSPSFEYLDKQGFISSLKAGTPTETNAPYLHLYGLKEKEKKVEKEMVFIKQGKGISEATPMHLDSKVDEALSNQSMILTKILA